MPPVSDKTELIQKAGFRRFFQAGTWEDYNRLFFDGLAPKYDFLNQVLSCGRLHRIRHLALRHIPIPSGARVLDICTGSGDMAILIARKYPGCQVTGVDVSQNMLTIARQKASGLGNIIFRTADAMDLPFQDESFDFVFMGFGLRNLTDIRKGIMEMKRVTRPGGCVSSLDLGKPQKGFLQGLYKIYFERLMPFLGRCVFHRNEFNSFQYLPESNKLFPHPDELVRLFESCGLTRVRRDDYMLGGISQQTGVVV